MFKNTLEKINALKHFLDLKAVFVFGVACFNFYSTIVALSGGDPNPLAWIHQSGVCRYGD
jgi:hypothetical protein